MIGFFDRNHGFKQVANAILNVLSHGVEVGAEGDRSRDETTMPRTKKNPEVTEEVKTEKPVKAAAAKVKAAAKKPAAKAKAAKLEIFIQSPMGGNITPKEIAAKLPKGAKSVFVRVDQNKLWWINGEETGSVDIW